MKLKRYCYLLHRWLGIVLCLLFAMWFFSGVVMMYVGFPKLDQQERLGALPALEASSIAWGPGLLLAKTPLPDIATLRLTSVANRWVYVLETRSGEHTARFADSGEVLSAGALLAVESASQFLKESEHLHSQKEPSYQHLIEVDQWSVSSALNPHRPLHVVALGDINDTQLYISSRTGEVVRDVNRAERFWNWLGANLHWLYPVQLRKHASLWADVVITLSLIACLVVLSGAVIGIQRLRLRKPYRGRDYSPYRGIAKWHHLLGLVAFVFLSTFTLSGLLSINPWGVFDDKEPIGPQLQRYQFGSHQPSPDTMVYTEPEELRDLLAGRSVVELSWHWLGGESYVVLEEQGDLPKALFREEGRLSNARIYAAISQLKPDTSIASMGVVDQYELYYYSHHGRHRPIPAIKAEFGDEYETWFYVDVRTGEIVSRLTSRGRLQRWLYNGLHSLDFNVLTQNRPAWDILVITLCVIGVVFSLTAIYLALLRLGTYTTTR